MLESSPHPPLALRPERALLHPLWWLALALMAFNDHVLKFAGAMPGWFTGKFSDVTGLFFAPLLLAALLQVRSKRGLMGCYIAVGAVFSALQLSPGFVGAWVELMASMGATWRVWSDPTDLLTLPMLWVSWRVFTPMIATPQPVTRRLQRLGQYAGVSAGVLCCMANEPPPPEVGPPGPGEVQVIWPQVSADIFLHNTTGGELIVRVRALREDVTIFDCDTLASDPGGVLQSDLFAEAQTWSMPTDSNLPLTAATPIGECAAVYVDGDGIAPAVVFWNPAEHPRATIPGGGVVSSVSRIGLFTDAERGLQLEETGIVYAPHALGRPDEISAACQLPDDGDRLDWSDLLLARGAELLIDMQTLGPDGCYGLDLRTPTDETTSRWYVCLPQDVWPFAQGESITINEGLASDGQTRFLEIDRVTDALGDAGAPRLTLRADAGALPDTAAIPITYQVTSQEACPALADACGSLSVASSVIATAGGERVDLTAGDRASLPGGGSAMIEVALLRAGRRPLIREECSVGATGITHDIEIISVFREEATP